MFRLSNYLLPLATSYLGCCYGPLLCFAIDTRPPFRREAIIQVHCNKKLTKDKHRSDSGCSIFIKNTQNAFTKIQLKAN